MRGAADYIKKNGGLDTEGDYPYWSLGTYCNPLREDRCTSCPLDPLTLSLSPPLDAASPLSSLTGSFAACLGHASSC